MKNQREIAPGLFIAGQPTADDLQAAKANGFRTIVNLRSADEDGALPDEERLVEGAGLTYAAIPVSPQTIDEAAVQRFIGAVDGENDLPAVAHCGSGGRAGIMVLLHLAMKHGWSLQQTLDEGQKLGIAPSETSPYRAFVESYVRRHSPGERL